MAIFETFTKRQKQLEKAGKQDVYQYEELPVAFRVQVIHIWDDAVGQWYEPGDGYFGSGRSSPANKFWSTIQSTLARELGVFTLTGAPAGPVEQCKKYLLHADAAGALDIIELSLRVIDGGIRQLDRYDVHEAQIKQGPDSAIEELNSRFREHGIGYQYVDGILVRLDSQFAHAKVVRPALGLLNASGFDGVCWRHNWDDCPKHIEIVELSRVVKSLANSEE